MNMKKNVNVNVNVSRVDSLDTIRALGAGRVMEGDKYVAFNPHVGASRPECWLVSKHEGGVWRRLALAGRDMLLTTSEARDLVGV